jgi:hypothetical protein
MKFFQRPVFLTIYSGVLTLVLAWVAVSGFASSKNETFDTINVKRINVVEPDGTLRMVISDHANLPGIIVRGKEEPFDRPQAGIIFYNDEGSENGGLIFGGKKNADGKIVNAGGSLSFDKYDANQIVQLIGVDDSEDRFAGLVVTDSHSGTDTRRRVWVGRDDDDTASVQLMDANGKKRMILEVKPDGSPQITFLDANGKVTNTIPANKLSKKRGQ